MVDFTAPCAIVLNVMGKQMIIVRRFEEPEHKPAEGIAEAGVDAVHHAAKPLFWD
jgi:hypothetical protein